MTNVIELAKQAGCEIRNGHAYNQHTGSLDQMLKRFAKLVRNAALEQCLEIADQCADADMHASMAANAIRQLKDNTP